MPLNVDWKSDKTSRIVDRAKYALPNPMLGVGRKAKAAKGQNFLTRETSPCCHFAGDLRPRHLDRDSVVQLALPATSCQEPRPLATHAPPRTRHRCPFHVAGSRRRRAPCDVAHLPSKDGELSMPPAESYERPMTAEQIRILGVEQPRIRLVSCASCPSNQGCVCRSDTRDDSSHVPVTGLACS